MVPRPDPQRYHPHTGFDQPPGRDKWPGVPIVEKRLDCLMRVLARLVAVLAEDFFGLATEVERVADLGRGDHFERLGLEAVESPKRVPVDPNGVTKLSNRMMSGMLCDRSVDPAI